MKIDYNNQVMIDNESCNTTLTPEFGEFTQTNTIHEDIKIYYDFSKVES